MGLVLEIRKFLSMKFWILLCYCIEGSIIIVLPLSADVIIASFFFSFVMTVFMVYHSVCTLWVNLVLLWCCIWVMLFET